MEARQVSAAGWQQAHLCVSGLDLPDCLCLMMLCSGFVLEQSG